MIVQVVAYKLLIVLTNGRKGQVLVYLCVQPAP